jgi:hypothetical protein
LNGSEEYGLSVCLITLSCSKFVADATTAMIERHALEGAKDFFEKSISLAKDLLRNESTFEDVRMRIQPADKPLVMEEVPVVLKDSTQDLVDDLSVSPPDADSPLKPKHPLARKSNTRSRRKTLEAQRIPTLSIPQSHSVPTPPRAFPLFPVLGFIILIIIFTVVPCYLLIQSIPEPRESIVKREEFVSNLEERLQFVQNLLGQVSRNITHVPGRQLKDQWTRHWSLLHDSSMEEELFPPAGPFDGVSDHEGWVSWLYHIATGMLYLCLKSVLLALVSGLVAIFIHSNFLH